MTIFKRLYLYFQNSYLNIGQQIFTTSSVGYANSRRCISFFKKMPLSDIKKIFVWKDEGEKNIHLQFEFCYLTGKRKNIIMNRPSMDIFESTKKRMECKLNTFKSPKKNKKDINIEKVEDKNEEIKIVPCGVNISDSTTNIDVFYGCDKIQIGEFKYKLIKDLPLLEKVSISLVPIVGCPVIPSCDWRNYDINDSPANVKFFWFVADKQLDVKIERNQTTGEVELDGWKLISVGEFYYPTIEYIGYYLCVLVDFGEDFLIKAAVSASPIIEIGENLIYETRQKKYCNSRLEGTKFRVVCYNLLSDLYLNLKEEQSKLFFPYCSVGYQEPSYRYPLILKELKGYKSDLLFLQEVDYRMNVRFLSKFLLLNGFKTDFLCKANAVNEGLTIAYQQDKFRLVDNFTNCKNLTTSSQNGIRVSDLTDSSVYPQNADIEKLLNTDLHMYEYFKTRPTVLQVLLLEYNADPNVQLLVANTHLLFDPAYEHIKLLQTILSIRYLSLVRKKIEENEPKKHIYSIFCGDFNSTPDSGVVQLFNTGYVSSNSVLWGKDRIGIDANNEKYTSLSGFPDYTNYTDSFLKKGFIGCLDYIWCYPQLNIDQVIPLPEHELVTKYNAIPSKIAPSDHLALVVDLDLTQN